MKLTVTKLHQTGLICHDGKHCSLTERRFLTESFCVEFACSCVYFLQVLQFPFNLLF